MKIGIDFDNTLVNTMEISKKYLDIYLPGNNLSSYHELEYDKEVEFFEKYHLDITKDLSLFEYVKEAFDYFKENSSKLIISYGRVTGEVLNTVETLNGKGVNVSVISLNKIKPINKDIIAFALGYKEVYFYEEAVKSGSIGQSFADMLFENGFKGKYEHIAIDDTFVPHANVSALLKKYKFDRESILEKFMEK
jgi:deoxyxylulose-5-phosphate synthase